MTYTTDENLTSMRPDDDFEALLSMPFTDWRKAMAAAWPHIPRHQRTAVYKGIARDVCLDKWLALRLITVRVAVFGEHDGEEIADEVCDETDPDGRIRKWLRGSVATGKAKAARSKSSLLLPGIFNWPNPGEEDA